MNRLENFMWGPVEGLVAQENFANDDPAALVDGPADDHGHEPNNDEILDEEEGDEEEGDEDEEDGEDDAAALEQEAIEDAEDFDGIMELFGMRGPLFGLFQNALFCALLVSVTVFFAVFLPYNIGRIALLIVANPGRALQAVFVLAKFIQDVALAGLGCACFLASYGAQILISPFNVASEALRATVGWSLGVTIASGSRIFNSITSEISAFSTTEVGNFSVASRSALHVVKGHIGFVLTGMTAPFVMAFADNETTKAEAAHFISNSTSMAWDAAKQLPTTMLTPSSWVLNVAKSDRLESSPLEPVFWTSMDRFWAILFGYFALTFVAGLYLSKASRQAPDEDENGQQGWDSTLLDVLTQASGVMKVILIISIEMLIFPLYCGLLLDVAMLPLFENTTLESRVYFTLKNPATSVFVHWFVGTGYMFHFALFVSMCRKIMRKGVLCKFPQCGSPRAVCLPGSIY